MDCNERYTIELKLRFTVDVFEKKQLLELTFLRVLTDRAAEDARKQVEELTLDDWVQLPIAKP